MKIKHFLSYLVNRLFVIPLSLYALVSINAFYHVLKPEFTFFELISKSSILAFLYLQFFFHIRLLDDIRDFNYDNEFHKDRPVQKGEISRGTLVSLLIVNALISLLIVGHLSSTVAVGINALFIYIGVLLYTFLMYHNFFIKDFEKKNLFIFLFSHQIIFIPLHILFFYLITNTFLLLNLHSLLVILYFALIPLIIELGRKLKPRHDINGVETDDTYSYKLGKKKAVLVFFIMILFELIISAFITTKGVNPAFIYLKIAIYCYLLFWLYKKYEVVCARGLLVTTVFGLYLPLLVLVT